MKNKFRDRFIEIREHSGLSQYDFRKKVFVSQQTVSAWETGRNSPTCDTLICLSELFGCTVGQLLGTEELDVSKLPILKYKEDEECLE